MRFSRTWDGLPVAEEPPFGAMVVVFRRVGKNIELLVLHRRAAGPPEYDGDWAWTPPSGGRHPGEAIDTCASRELAEEAGLDLECLRVDHGLDWAIYVAETPSDATVTLDAEHDECQWLDPEQALEVCRPIAVRDKLAIAIEAIERAR